MGAARGGAEFLMEGLLFDLSEMRNNLQAAIRRIEQNKNLHAIGFFYLLSGKFIDQPFVFSKQGTCLYQHSTSLPFKLLLLMSLFIIKITVLVNFR
jgi:hypothetical protein